MKSRVVPVEFMDRRERHFTPLPDPGMPFAHQCELVLLAQCVYGEAEGEGMPGKLAVAHVVMNRLDDPRWPDTGHEVILQKWQFSAFNPGSPRLKAMQAPKGAAWDDSFEAAVAVAYGFNLDFTGGANHYCTRSVVSRTSWARGREPSAEIEGHVFFNIPR